MYFFIFFLGVATQLTGIVKEKADTAGSNKTRDEIIFEHTSLFAEVVSLVQEKHFQPNDFERAMNKAIKAFVADLDPHSAFFDKEGYSEMLDSVSGTFFGIGIIIDNMRKEKDKMLLVIEVLEDGPADHAGILPQDKIVEVDGKALDGLSTEKIISMIKGEKETTVELKILRNNHPDLITVLVTRDVVKEQQSLCFLIKEAHVYYLSLSMFSEIALTQIEHLLKKIVAGEAKGLILDLRNNSGGLLSSVQDIAGLFVPKNSPVVITKNNKNQIVETYRTKRAPVTSKWDIPIVILINNYTASAAEILAGVLKFYVPSVVLIGERTFGKGSVQEVIPLHENYAVKLTTTLYFLPDETPVQQRGIAPDITVIRTLPETEQTKWLIKHYGREETFQNSINPEGKKEEKSVKKSEDNNTKRRKGEDRIKRLLENDNQFQEVICFIKMALQMPKEVPIAKIISAFQPIPFESIVEIK